MIDTRKFSIPLGLLASGIKTFPSKTERSLHYLRKWWNLLYSLALNCLL